MLDDHDIDNLEPNPRKPSLNALNSRRVFTRYYLVAFFPIAIFIFFNDAYPNKGSLAVLLVAIYIFIVAVVILIRRHNRSNKDLLPPTHP